MGRLALVSAVAGLASCNWFFGLEETRFIDEDVDARFRGCPAVGTAPEFTTIPTAITSGPFPFSYTFDEARTFAVADVSGIVEGPVDSMELTPLDLPRDSGDYLTSPRVAPEGDELFVRVRNSVNAWSMRRYSRTSPRVWVRAGTDTSLMPAEQISTPSRRTPERRMIRRTTVGDALVEYAERGGSWTMVASYDRNRLGVMDRQLEDPQLSPDGLRLVFTLRETVGRPIYYADRPSIDDAFGTARIIVQLSGDAEPGDPILTQDCVRLYFVVFPGLTYVEQ